MGIDVKRKVLLDAIESTLSDIFGNHASHEIFDYLEHRGNLRKEEIPSKMREMQTQLRLLLGDTVAELVIEKINEKYEANAETIANS